MRSALPFVLPLVLAVGGCAGPDLPIGWEGASRLPVVQAACGGNPYEPHDERLEVEGAVGRALVDLRETTFRCEQTVEAFVREGDATVDVLVQPEDMHPSMVAACDCLYDVGVDVPLDPGTYVVSAYRRWDALNEPNDPVAVGVPASISVE